MANDCFLAVNQVGWRPEDLAAVVQSPRKVAYVEGVTRKLEMGDLKLRVRAHLTSVTERRSGRPASLNGLLTANE